MSEKILVVDDTLVIRKLLAKILTKAGYELVEAEDGERVLEIALEERPDIILLDVVMPGKDGYCVCEEIKQRAELSDIPVVFLSGKSGAPSKIKGLELGAVDYITKPFDKGEVLARVRNQLKIQRLTRSLKEANRKLVEKQVFIDRDLRAAADIQKSLIPARRPSIADLELAWRFLPCDRVGGDIFNLRQLDDDHWAFYMVDVSGHGVPAAMVTVSVSQMLSEGNGRILWEEQRRESGCIRRPAKVLEILDEEYPVERFDKFFTMGYAVVDTREGRLDYSCAAHPMPILVHADGSTEALDAGGTIIGLGNRVPFEDGRVEIRPGDRLFLYTDGIVEFQNDAGECFGEERLGQTLVASLDRDLDGACGHVIDSVMGFGNGVKAQDDMSILGLEFASVATGSSQSGRGATRPDG